MPAKQIAAQLIEYDAASLTRPVRTAEASGGSPRLLGGAVDGVDHRFEQSQPTRRQSDARPDHNAVIAVACHASLNGLDRGLEAVRPYMKD